MATGVDVGVVQFTRSATHRRCKVLAMGAVAIAVAMVIGRMIALAFRHTLKADHRRVAKDRLRDRLSHAQRGNVLDHTQDVHGALERVHELAGLHAFHIDRDRPVGARPFTKAVLDLKAARESFQVCT